MVTKYLFCRKNALKRKDNLMIDCIEINGNIYAKVSLTDFEHQLSVTGNDISNDVGKWGWIEQTSDELIHPDLDGVEGCEEQAEIINQLNLRLKASPGCLRPQDARCDCPPCGGPND